MGFDVKRVNDPTDRYTIIMEEYDKNERRVPKWKVQWCKENFKHMIGKDDNEQFSMSQSQILKKQKTGGKSLQKKKTKKMTAKKSKMLSSMKSGVSGSKIEVEESEMEEDQIEEDADDGGDVDDADME